MENKTLQQKIYEISNSELPLDTFYNDIQKNKNKNFNKELALKDIEKITNYITELQQENKTLKETIEKINKILKILTETKNCEIIEYDEEE